MLVGHSYGGMVITGAADRAPDRVDSLVYLDAVVPAGGDSCWSLVSEQERRWYLDVDETGYASRPLPFFDARATPHPIASLLQPLRLTADLGNLRRRDYVYAAGWADQSPFTATYERLSADPGWTTHALPGGHNLMRDTPDELAKISARRCRLPLSTHRVAHCGRSATDPPARSGPPGPLRHDPHTAAPRLGGRRPGTTNPPWWDLSDRQVAAYERLRDDGAQDVVRALADAHQDRVAVEALDLELRGVAVAAVHLHRVDRGLEGHLRAEHLRHPGLPVGATAPDRVGRPVRHQAGGLELDRHVGELELDRLELGDRLAERLALLGVRQRLVVGALRDADRRGRRC